VFQQNPQFQTPQPADDDNEDEKPAANAAGAPQPRGPVFNTFPQPQVVNPPSVAMPQPGAPVAQPQAPQPGQPPAASPTPVAPYGGVSVPGMVAPPPPNTPGQPVRRPGGPGGL
jgi:hypothetical protein